MISFNLMRICLGLAVGLFLWADVLYAEEIDSTSRFGHFCRIDVSPAMDRTQPIAKQTCGWMNLRKLLAMGPSHGDPDGSLMLERMLTRTPIFVCRHLPPSCPHSPMQRSSCLRDGLSKGQSTNNTGRSFHWTVKAGSTSDARPIDFYVRQGLAERGSPCSHQPTNAHWLAGRHLTSPVCRLTRRIDHLSERFAKIMGTLYRPPAGITSIRRKMAVD